jgi:hypothetical protein
LAGEGPGSSDHKRAGVVLQRAAVDPAALANTPAVTPTSKLASVIAMAGLRRRDTVRISVPFVEALLILSGQGRGDQVRSLM